MYLCPFYCMGISLAPKQGGTKSLLLSSHSQANRTYVLVLCTSTIPNKAGEERERSQQPLLQPCARVWRKKKRSLLLLHPAPRYRKERVSWPPLTVVLRVAHHHVRTIESGGGGSKKKHLLWALHLYSSAWYIVETVHPPWWWKSTTIIMYYVVAKSYYTKNTKRTVWFDMCIHYI